MANYIHIHVGTKDTGAENGYLSKPKTKAAEAKAERQETLKKERSANAAYNKILADAREVARKIGVSAQPWM